MDYIVLDTDVASLSVKEKLPPPLFARLVGKQPCISFITLGELMVWAERNHWGPRRRARLERWINGVILLPYTAEDIEKVARKWGEIMAYALNRGKPRPLNDSWIAACCLTFELPLATLNVKDFADFAEHEGLTIVTP